MVLTLAKTGHNFQPYKYYKNGGIFLDTILDLDIDEHYTPKDFEEMFSHLYISKILGDDIYSKDKEENLNKIRERVTLLFTAFSQEKKWQNEAYKRVLEIQNDLNSCSEYDLRTQLLSQLIGKKGSRLNSLWENFSRMNLHCIPLYDSILFSDDRGGHNSLGVGVETGLGDTLKSFHDLLSKIYHVSCLGSIYCYRDFDEIRKQIEEIFELIYEKRISHNGAMQTIRKLHTYLLMKNFYLSPNTPNLRDKTQIPSIKLLHIGHIRSLNISEAIAKKVEIILDGSLTNSFYCDSDEDTTIHISDTNKGTDRYLDIDIGSNTILTCEGVRIQVGKIRGGSSSTGSKVIYKDIEGGSIITSEIGEINISSSSGEYITRNISHISANNTTGNLKVAGAHSLSLMGSSELQVETSGVKQVRKDGKVLSRIERIRQWI